MMAWRRVLLALTMLTACGNIIGIEIVTRQEDTSVDDTEDALPAEEECTEATPAGKVDSTYRATVMADEPIG